MRTQASGSRNPLFWVPLRQRFWRHRPSGILLFRKGPFCRCCGMIEVLWLSYENIKTKRTNVNKKLQIFTMYLEDNLRHLPQNFVSFSRLLTTKAEHANVARFVEFWAARQNFWKNIPVKRDATTTSVSHRWTRHALRPCVPSVHSVR